MPKTEAKTKAKPRLKNNKSKILESLIGEDEQNHNGVDHDESGANSIQKLVREQLKDITPNTDEYDEDGEERHPDETIQLSGPEYIREKVRAEDEMVIDDLIRNIPRNQGYYILLYRELSPNQYELKERIDHFHNWADLEWEIASLVRRNTERSPRKWGSGRYRVIFKRERGLRGPKYDPIDFIIDAGDGADMEKVGVVDPAVSAEAQLEHLSKLMNTMKGVMPTPTDPNQVQQQLAQSFMQGLQAKASDSSAASNQTNQMMMLMMGMMKEFVTAMRPTADVTPKESMSDTLVKTLTIMKEMGVLPNPNQSHRNGLVESLTELKAIGVDPFKQQDTMAQLQQIKTMASILQDITGGGGSGERPSLGEKLVDTLVPMVPEILTNIKGLSDNYLRAQTINVARAPGVNLTPQHQAVPYQPQPQPQRQPAINENEAIMGGISGGRDPKQPSSAQESDDMIFKAFLSKFKAAMLAQNTDFFTELTMTVQKTSEGRQLLESVARGQVATPMLVMIIQQWGGTEFADPAIQEKLVAYADEYRKWVIWVAQEQVKAAMQAQSPSRTDQASPAPSQATVPSQPPATANGAAGAMVTGKCGTCGSEYEYDSLDQYQQDNGTCDSEENGQVCGGTILVST